MFRELIGLLVDESNSSAMAKILSCLDNNFGYLKYIPFLNSVLLFQFPGKNIWLNDQWDKNFVIYFEKAKFPFAIETKQTKLAQSELRIRMIHEMLITILKNKLKEKSILILIDDIHW